MYSIRWPSPPEPSRESDYSFAFFSPHKNSLLDDDAWKVFTTCIFLHRTRGGLRIRILRRQAAVRRGGIVGGGGTLLCLVPTRREGRRGRWRRRRQDQEETRPVGPNGQGFRIAPTHVGRRPRLLQIARAGGCRLPSLPLRQRRRLCRLLRTAASR